MFSIPDRTPGLRGMPDLYRRCRDLIEREETAELHQELVTQPDYDSVAEALYDLLVVAIYLNDVRGAKGFLESGAPVVDPRDLGEPPLAVAIAHATDDTGMIDLLLTHGANPNEIVMQGRRPLILAVERQNMGVAQVLLAHGADPELEDIDNYYTPLMLASALCQLDMMRYLLQHGVDPNHKNVLGQTAYDVAGKECRSEARRILPPAS